MPIPVWAEVIRIDDVEVEISASNPVEARERAFMEARRTGYRLALEASGTPVPQRLSDDIVNTAVIAIEVQSERQAAGRYSARFSLFVETAQPGPREAPPKRGNWIYVIPAERAEGRIDRLWRRDTAWTQSFRAVGPIAGQSPLTPSGDEDDRALISPARLAANDASALAGLGQRHGAPVAVAILDRGPPSRAGRSDGPILGVELLYWSRSSGPQTLRRSFSEKTEITTANALVQFLLEQILEPPPPSPPSPSQATASTPPPPPPVSADATPTPPTESFTQPPPEAAALPPPVPEIIRPFAFDFADAAEWRQLRAGLAAIPGLTLHPATITIGRVIGQLRFGGPAEALDVHLAALGQASITPPSPSTPPLPPAAAAPRAAESLPAAPATEGDARSFTAHLVSTRSEEEAMMEWRRLTLRYPDLLTDRVPTTWSIDLGPDRGIWWRMGVGGFTTRRDAESWCATLASYGQYCRVAGS